MDYRMVQKIEQIEQMSLQLLCNLEEIKKQISNLQWANRSTQDIAHHSNNQLRNLRQELVEQKHLLLELEFKVGNPYHDELGQFTDEASAVTVSNNRGSASEERTAGRTVSGRTSRNNPNGDSGVSAGNQVNSKPKKEVGKRLREEVSDPYTSKPAKNMSASSSGVDAIAESEGFERSTYDDDAKNPTIGYGHKLRSGESFPDGITDEEAEKLFNEDIQITERAIRNNVEVPLTQNQFDALSSFIYNVGEGNFKESTLLEKLNNEDYEGAADELLRWNKITDPKRGKKVPSDGLSNRREKEREQFLDEGLYY